jgi:hypothetical protein
MATGCSSALPRNVESERPLICSSTVSVVISGGVAWLRSEREVLVELVQGVWLLDGVLRPEEQLAEEWLMGVSLRGRRSFLLDLKVSRLLSRDSRGTC